MTSARTKKTPRVLIDSSVLMVVAISNRAAARDLLRQGFRGELDLYISPEVLEETHRNLALKAPEAVPDFEVFRELLTAKIVEPARSLVLRAAEVVVVKDAPIVAAAVEAKATYLATYGRQHFLSGMAVPRVRPL
jgi:predicted nucleic acid-binding protein